MSTHLQRQDIKSILIIGIRGVLAQTTAKLLRKEFPEAKITGVDSREILAADTLSQQGITCLHIKYTRGSFENLFRNNSFDLVYQIGRIIHSHSDPQYKMSRYLDLGLMETRRVLDLCLHFAVKKVVILSTFHVYGAHSDNSVFIREDFPLRASVIHPPLLHSLEVDQIATNWMWQNQDKVEAVILRPCNVIGPKIQNTISSYLTFRFAPRPLDYNPMFQFIHESDMAQVLVLSSLQIPTGIYNVAPNDFLSINQALDFTGVKGIPTSIFLLDKVTALIRNSGITMPDYLIDYLKYSCLIDGSRLREIIPNHTFRYSTQQALGLMAKNQPQVAGQ